MIDMVCLILSVAVLMGIGVSANTIQVKRTIKGLIYSLLIHFILIFPHESRYVYLRSSP